MYDRWWDGIYTVFSCGCFWPFRHFFKPVCSIDLIETSFSQNRSVPIPTTLAMQLLGRWCCEVVSLHCGSHSTGCMAGCGPHFRCIFSCLHSALRALFECLAVSAPSSRTTSILLERRLNIRAFAILQFDKLQWPAVKGYLTKLTSTFLLTVHFRSLCKCFNFEK